MASKPKMSLIAAQCKSGGIGKDGDLPWKLKREYAHFKKMTSFVAKDGNRNAVVMGRKTWESIGAKPLKGRLNVILTRTPPQGEQDDVVRASSLDDALALLHQPPYVENLETIWICGGENIYREAIAHPSCHRVYLTQIDADYECDTFFPTVDKSIFELVTDTQAPQGKQTENGINWECHVWQRR